MNHSSRTRFPVALMTLMLGLMAFLALSGARCAWAQTPDAPTFFYSNGKKNELVPSDRWVAVQVDPTASVAAVDSLVKTRSGVDTAAGTRRIRRKGRDFLVIPLAKPAPGTSGVSARLSTRQNLRSVPGVRHVPRAFGNGKSPIVETDMIMVRFQPSVSAKQAAAILAKYGASVARPLGNYAPNGYLAVIKNPEVNAPIEVANAIYEKEPVVFSHPNF
ncbi:MAG TPA: hypothetical protein VF719_02575, partial [Abditibacteriaceae bacterium]